MTNAKRVYIGERAEELVHVQFDLERWHCCFVSCIVPRCSVNSFGYIFLDKVEEYFVFLNDEMSTGT